MIIKVIADATTSEYVGEIGLFNINELHHRANSYCILLPEYRKKVSQNTFPKNSII